MISRAASRSFTSFKSCGHHGDGLQERFFQIKGSGMAHYFPIAIRPAGGAPDSSQERAIRKEHLPHGSDSSRQFGISILDFCRSQMVTIFFRKLTGVGDPTVAKMETIEAGPCGELALPN